MTGVSRWMLYGANGYSGELIARAAVARGMRPILAGRRAAQIEPLARELGVEHRVFGLAAPERVQDALNDVALVLHCAGPFAATSAPMIEACLASGTHYLDITGEIAVFEHAHGRSDDARTAGVVICPGVAFDVVPTDCVAVTLKDALPDATHLALAFDTRSGLSRGTAKTTIEGLRAGGAVRENHEIVAVPQAYKSRRIDCGDGEKYAMTIPWGDVSTSYHSTGIPNIEVYTTVPRPVVHAARVGNHLGWLWRRQPVITGLQRLAEAVISGPDADRRAALPTYVWGEVRNAAGDVRTARVRTANIYDVTIDAPLGIVQRLLDSAPAGGAYTPAGLMGRDYVTRLPGSTPIHVYGDPAHSS